MRDKMAGLFHSIIARNSILDVFNRLSKSVTEHESGEQELFMPAYEDYKHDLEILKALALPPSLEGNEALVYSSKDIQNAFEAGVKSIKDKLPSLEGIEHVEKCDYCKDWTKISANCPYCHGTGEITRQAEWGEVMEMVMYCFNPGQIKLFDIDRNGNIQFILKSGGRLRVKEKP